MARRSGFGIRDADQPGSGPMTDVSDVEELETGSADPEDDDEEGDDEEDRAARARRKRRGLDLMRGARRRVKR